MYKRQVLGLLLFSVLKDVSREPRIQIALFAEDTAAYIAVLKTETAIIRLQRQLNPE